MRAIIRAIKRQTNDEEAAEIKKKVAEALKDYQGVEIQLQTME